MTDLKDNEHNAHIETSPNIARPCCACANVYHRLNELKFWDFLKESNGHYSAKEVPMMD